MKAELIQQHLCTQTDIEDGIAPGTFIPASGMPAFVRRVQALHLRLEAMAGDGHALEAVAVYETLLAACVYKAYQCTDPLDLLPGLFPSLFRGWIHARQEADLSPKETVLQVVQWMLCMQDERFELSIDTVVEALDRKGYAFLIDYYLMLLQNGLQAWRTSDTDTDKCPPGHVLWPVAELRAIYAAKGDLQAYAALTLLVGLKAGDCRTLAAMAEQQQNPELALEWVERGLRAEPKAPPRQDIPRAVAKRVDDLPCDLQHVKDRFAEIAPWDSDGYRSQYFKEVRSIWEGIVGCLDTATPVSLDTA